MNVERILALAAKIETLPHENEWMAVVSDSFTMRYWAYNCGTPACIGGWTQKLWSDVPMNQLMSGDDIGALLGLSSEQADALFNPVNAHEDGYAAITPSHAAAVLRHLAATGQVDWSVQS